MLYIQETCPCCRTQPIIFIVVKERVLLQCWECAACYLSPDYIDLEHMLVPDKQGLLPGIDPSFVVDKANSRLATIEEVNAAGWQGKVAGEWDA